MDSTGTKQLNVDFVDLRPEAEEQAVQQEARPEARRNLANTPPLNPAAPNVQSDAVPAFVSGDDVIVAIDPSVAAPGSQLTFWDETGSEALGSATIGEDPLVVKFAARSFTGHSGTGLLITAEEPSGASGLIQLQPQEISEP